MDRSTIQMAKEKKEDRHINTHTQRERERMGERKTERIGGDAAVTLCSQHADKSQIQAPLLCRTIYLVNGALKFYLLLFSICSDLLIYISLSPHPSIYLVIYVCRTHTKSQIYISHPQTV